DVNGDLVIDELDQRPVAFARSGTPILSFGLNGSFDYRGFNLSYSLAGASMFSYRPGDDLQIPYNSDHIGGAYIWSRWRRVDPYDDNSEWIPGKYPPLRKSQGSHSSYRDSDFNDVRVRYLRVRRLELGYTVPPDILSRFSCPDLRVYAGATNPYVLDNVGHWGSYPESANCCGQFYPPANVVSVGFSASLGGVPRAGTAVSVPVDGDD